MSMASSLCRRGEIRRVIYIARLAATSRGISSGSSITLVISLEAAASGVLSWLAVTYANLFLHVRQPASAEISS